jgi:hypothetical protein
MRHKAEEDVWDGDVPKRTDATAGSENGAADYRIEKLQ